MSSLSRPSYLAFFRHTYGSVRLEVAVKPCSEQDAQLVSIALSTAETPREAVELLRACPLSGWCGVRLLPPPRAVDPTPWQNLPTV